MIDIIALCAYHARIHFLQEDQNDYVQDFQLNKIAFTRACTILVQSFNIICNKFSQYAKIMKCYKCYICENSGTTYPCVSTLNGLA